EVGANHASHAAFGNYYDVDSQNHHSIHLALPPLWKRAGTGQQPGNQCETGRSVSILQKGFVQGTV
ncbi:hypothetical protein LH384_33980, partial [Pseudomonas aeruginosa]|nr:hypothetical protein [Pseudomonas aeruginosa]